MKKTVLTACVLTPVAFFCASCLEQSSPKANAGLEKRVNEIVGKMTQDEKMKFLGGTGFTGDKIGETYPIERLGLPAIKMTDATLGSKLTKGATLFPAYICQAAAFDPTLANAYGNAVAQQCAADGYRILLGPGVNIYRVPNCGRNFEYLGEDPYLASRTVVEYIKGVQQAGVIATVKHFVANNSDYYRSNSNSVVSERALREIYMPAFKAAVQQAGVKAVMTSYNLLNGTYSAENKWAITDVLRNEWGFKGMVMTDWCGARTSDLLINSGSDLEMPEPDVLKADKVKALLNEGKTSQARIDQCIAEVLRPCFEMDLFDKPTKDESLRNNWPKHAEIARQVAREGLVLLKNQDILPLDRSKLKTIALVGANAEKTSASGGGAAGFEPGADFVTYAAAIRDSAGNDIKVINAMPEQAKDADVALVFATMLEHENMDRPFAFPAETIKMINDTAAANANTVVIVSLGGAVEMQSWINSVKGLIYSWYPGTYGATALGEAIFGDINPSGKLPISIEKKPEDTHYFGNYLPADAKLDYEFPGWNTQRPNYDINYREDILVGYRWYNTKGIEPMFPFGFGLSYTTFDFSEIKVSRNVIKAGQELVVSCKVTNTGKVAGEEVAQLYIQDVESSVLRPTRELKGFERVALKPGESKTIKFTVCQEELAFWDNTGKDWKTESGKFIAHVGNSSGNLTLNATFSFE